ncbi:MAG: metallopeptidase [Lachnospiraceae bacterium]|nr:metallopeptidase [Lachnospiraceae bacterium]
MNSKSFRESQTEWEQKLSEKILTYVRDEIRLELRFFHTVLSAFVYQEDSRLTTAATDGEMLFYPAEQILRLFEKNPAYLDRIYLHSVLHCLFSHLWLRGGRDPYQWGIACDIAVEYTIDHMDKECTRRILSLCRIKLYKELKEMGDGISAAKIYRLLSEKTPEDLKRLYLEFFTDDHVFWPKEEKLSEKQMALQAKWKKLGRQSEMERKRRGSGEKDGEELLSCQMKAQRRKRSYREFLRGFMILKEERRLDPDEFDLGFYAYGFSVYKNMQLIEPLESRESKKIKDFVIVVDTSYSTSGSLIRSFLKETFALMTEKNNFFHTARIHLIQADAKVQSDILLTGEQEIEKLFADFQIQGGGNTDFRPAFRYVDSLMEQGAFTDLCGLLYFTEGKGNYPEKKPSYKTAFLFLEDYEEEKVPAWAIRMQLEKEMFEP